MISDNIVLLILVAAGAFYAGFQVGRFKTLSERVPPSRGAPDDDADGPALDGPIVHAGPPRPRAAPPPTSAGTDAGAASTAPPRRSTKPPPAAAGLLERGAGKSGKEPN